MAAAVVFQCTACRSLGSAVDVVVAPKGERAGLVCPACRFTSWLPVSGSAVHDTSSTVTVDPVAAPALPPAAFVPPPGADASTALVPAAPTAMSSAFGSEAIEKIQRRLAQQPVPSAEQRPLSDRFDRLLTSSWGAEAEHKSLLKAAAMANELAFVGGRYRAVLDVVRDEPRAKASQQELLTLAMATMKNTKDLGSTETQGGTSPGKMAAMLVLLAVFLIGGGLFISKIVSGFQSLDQIEK